MPCVLHVYAHTYTFISPVACSLRSCFVVLWFEVICIHSCVVCDCCYLCFFFVCLIVCLFVRFFSAYLLTGAPGGSKAGFPTEAVDCLLFVFTGVAAGCLVFHCFLLLFLLYFCFFSFHLFFPCPPVQSSTITC